MDKESFRIAENNEIIDHIEAVRAIVDRKCARCAPGINGCMGCTFDPLSRDCIPAAIDRILDLMGRMPNDRRDVIAAGSEKHRQREARWRAIMSVSQKEKED